jgi:uncharacterized protein YcbK (DUF882 family)
MIPLLSIALSLITNVTDMAHMFVPAGTEEQPAGLTFYFENRHEAANFALVDDGGAAQLDVLKEFSHFVRCWRTGREKMIHPRTAEIVTAMARHFNVARVDIVSGYRARPYGAPHSKHFLGRAMDIRVPGVQAKQVAAWVWQNFRGVGVGYYPKQQFVHIDTREQDIRWVDTSPQGESAHARYFVRTGESPLPVNAPRLAYDSPRSVGAPSAVDGSIEMAALQNILSTSFDPLAQ